MPDRPTLDAEHTALPADTHRFLTETLFPARSHVTTVSELDALWA